MDPNSPTEFPHDTEFGKVVAAGEVVTQFIPNSLRTLSPGFSGSKVPVIAIINAVAHFAQAAQRLDLIKKVLFYDKASAYAQLVEIMPILGVDPTAPEVLCMTHDIPNKDKDILHAVIGICTESGELAEALLQTMLGHAAELDDVNVKEESGDILWYMAIAFDRMGTDFPSEMDRVIRKLRTRFPDKFTNDKANTRDLTAERATLEIDTSSEHYKAFCAHVSANPGDSDDVAVQALRTAFPNDAKLSRDDYVAALLKTCRGKLDGSFPKPPPASVIAGIVNDLAGVKRREAEGENNG